MKTTIYHNPRCRKSRETLALLQEHEQDIEVVRYLEEPPSAKTLASLIELLNIKPMQLVRTNEALWKERFKGKELTDLEIIEAMAAHPKLMERPVVVKNGRARIGRPPESVLDIL